ncbi:unnamed protein product [Scytosiphon promiscuus]
MAFHGSNPPEHFPGEMCIRMHGGFRSLFLACDLLALAHMRGGEATEFGIIRIRKLISHLQVVTKLRQWRGRCAVSPLHEKSIPRAVTGEGACALSLACDTLPWAGAVWRSLPSDCIYLSLRSALVCIDRRLQPVTLAYLSR